MDLIHQERKQIQERINVQVNSANVDIHEANQDVGQEMFSSPVKAEQPRDSFTTP